MKDLITSHADLISHRSEEEPYAAASSSPITRTCRKRSMHMFRGVEIHRVHGSIHQYDDQRFDQVTVKSNHCSLLPFSGSIVVAHFLPRRADFVISGNTEEILYKN